MGNRTHSIVIGGTKGIGKTIAKAFTDAGHVVSVVGRSAEGDRGFRCDLHDAQGIKRCVGQILQAGPKPKNLVFCQKYRGESLWHGEIDANLTATWRIVELMCNDFDTSSGGSIVVIGSSANRYIAGEQSVGYHVAKAGLVQLVRYYAFTFGSRGIRVNSISPGTIIKDEAKAFHARNNNVTELYERAIPLGRMGVAADVSNVVEFLCSPKASFLTGQDIVVDGGISLQWHETLAREAGGLGQVDVTQRRR
jgi:NAD(P)-dependent dehydrogenase (short-subunit alcohol dehydrogenase family)